VLAVLVEEKIERLLSEEQDAPPSEADADQPHENGKRYCCLLDETAPRRAHPSIRWRITATAAQGACQCAPLGLG
jgi:hypothetical protein